MVTSTPEPFVVHESGAYLHGTKADLSVGDLLVPIVEPEGALQDDPNVTDKKLPGNPTHSYRSREPVKIVGEITGWVGHSTEQLQAFRDGLEDLKRRGQAVIYD